MVVTVPDLRYGLEITDHTATFAALDFSVTRSAIDAGGSGAGIRVPAGAAEPQAGR